MISAVVLACGALGLIDGLVRQFQMRASKRNKSDSAGKGVAQGFVPAHQGLSDGFEGDGSQGGIFGSNFMEE